MRLLYFVNQIENSGGIERIVIDKVNYLAQQPDYELHLAFYGQKGMKPFYTISKEVRLWAIEEDTRTHSFVKKMLKVWNVYCSASSIIKEVKPDLIVNANTRIVSYFLPSIFRTIPKVVELHFTYEGLQMMNKEMYRDCKWKSSVNNMLRRYFYARYNRCVVLVNDDVRAWGFKNVIVIPNFTNYTSTISCNEKREKMVINVGRLENQKDHRTLIEAWSIVHDMYPDWKLEIWGNGKLRGDLQSQIQQMKLQKSVFLKGVTPNIDKEYARASVFALSSRYEGMPLVAIEAMTAGVPCVSFDISGISDVITDGVDGVIVKSHTAEAFAKEIVTLIENTDQCKLMSRKCLEAVKVFDKRMIMDKWIRLFGTLCKKTC